MDKYRLVKNISLHGFLVSENPKNVVQNYQISICLLVLDKNLFEIQ
jgi:hypothetical protein